MLSASNLSLEVTALRTLRSLDLTAGQLSSLAALAAGAGDRPERQAGKGPEKYREDLRALREAQLAVTRIAATSCRRTSTAWRKAPRWSWMRPSN